MRGHEQEYRDEAKDDDPGHLESLEQAIDSALGKQKTILTLAEWLLETEEAVSTNKLTRLEDRIA